MRPIVRLAETAEQIAETGGTVWAGVSPFGGAAVGLRIPEMDD